MEKTLCIEDEGEDNKRSALPYYYIEASASFSMKY